MRKTRKLTITALIAAVTTLSSSVVYIPVGFAKILPIQHLANVLSAVLLGPSYAVAQAFIASTLRNISGTGSVFAYPGSMIGAFLAGVLYRRTKKPSVAALGEVFGTGILGAVASYPLAVLFVGQKATLFGFIPSFATSSFAGAITGYLLLRVLLKRTILGGNVNENSVDHRRL